MPDEPQWPDAAEFVTLNRLIVEGSGEPHILINAAGLESACARPRNLWVYDDEWRLAYLGAALICSLGRNHPFAQGNKRTALIGAMHFFENNDHTFTYEDVDDFAPLVEDCILGHVHESILAEELDLYLVEELF